MDSLTSQVAEVIQAAPELPLPPSPTPNPSSASRFFKNSASNLVRTALTAIVSILLPAFLTHHLPVRTYAAWVLILQLSAYVAYLNLGVQTALAKFVAEYEARQDLPGCGRVTSVGLILMLGAGAVGILLSVGLAWRVPVLFRDMPHELLHDVRVSILLVGISLSLGLASSVFSAVFMGLQRYQIPTVIGTFSRILYGTVLCIAVATHSSLVVMSAAAAVVNLLTSAAEVWAWHRFLPAIRVNLFSVDRDMVRRMLAYCSVLTVWSACMLFISGLDVTIVGHYAFPQVAFYSIANAPTNLILMVVGSLLAPLLPATSALSATADRTQMGEVLLRATRYSTFILLAVGLPLMVAGYVVMRVWVGTNYATQSILFLHILLLANLIRNICGPYATMVVATSRQRVATASPLTEAAVNLCASIYLARHFGAVGVAVGTLIGAITGVSMHFGVSMHYTFSNLAISRLRLFVRGVLIPATMAIPSVLLLPLWWVSGAPTLRPIYWLLWLVSTAAIAWKVSLLPPDRLLLISTLKKSRLTAAFR